MTKEIAKKLTPMLRVTVVALLISIPTLLLALTVEGNAYPKEVSIQGKQLKLVGAGLREKWFFDVYTMGAYTEGGACGAKAQIKGEEVKYLRIDMLRDVPAEKMAQALKEAFDKNTPKNAPNELKQQVNTFVSYFKKECTKGTKIEFVYAPGKGTVLKQNGQKLGPNIPGKPFSDVLWSCYFGGNTCCPKLKKQILSHCK